MTPNSIDFDQVTESMLKVLDARSKDIIVRRYGLKADKRETLEGIGKEYGITRERVRQIESNAKKALTALDETYLAANELLAGIFADHGGLLTEEHATELITKRLGQAVSINTVSFFLEILPNFTYKSTEKLFNPHWRHEPSLNTRVEDIVAIATDILKEANHPTNLSILIEAIQQKVGSADVSRDVIYATLVASKNISRTAFEEWGLIGWAETSPRGVGDKAYAVLRRHGSPTHFRDITNMINEAKFDHKKANPQTVHNELIKDSRFVLVGRGLYGLKEWGFMTGTVADVLEAILRKSEQPLTREELIDRVLKQRMVKKNTILLSLQNTQRFKKTDKNRYTLSEHSRT